MLPCYTIVKSKGNASKNTLGTQLKQFYTFFIWQKEEFLIMTPVVITKDNFESEVLKAEGTVLIDFWATWCGPCRMLSPIVDEVASEHTDVKVGKINVDEQPELAQQFGIMSIPTLIVFRNGQKVNESIGLIPKEKVEELIG